MSEEETQQEDDTQEVPEGYVPKDKVNELQSTVDELQSKLDDKQSAIDEVAYEKTVQGKKKAIEQLGVDTDIIPDEEIAEKSADEIVDEYQEVNEVLKEEKIAEIKQQVEQNVKEEYEPYKNKYEALRQERDQDLILDHAESYFDEEVIEGDFRQDFIEDVKRRTEFKEDDDGNFRRIAVDEDGDPIPSNRSDRDVKQVDEVVKELSDGKWNRFAIDEPQKSDSGYNENSSSRGNLTKQDVNRTEYVAEHGAQAYLSLPES